MITSSTWLQVAKQWFDYSRSSFNFVKFAKELKSPLTFRKTADFDENGIIYWIGSNARSANYPHTNMMKTIQSASKVISH